VTEISLLVAKIQPFLASISCFAISYLLITGWELWWVNQEWSKLRWRKHNRSVMVAVCGTPCTIPLRNSKSNGRGAQSILPVEVYGMRFSRQGLWRWQASGILSLQDAGSVRLWDISLLLRGYTALYPRTLSSTRLLNLNTVNQLIVVMVKYGVLFEVRTGFLNIIQTSFGFKGLTTLSATQIM
jgi:hypothetical protein